MDGLHTIIRRYMREFKASSLSSVHLGIQPGHRQPEFASKDRRLHACSMRAYHSEYTSFGLSSKAISRMRFLQTRERIVCWRYCSTCLPWLRHCFRLSVSAPLPSSKLRRVNFTAKTGVALVGKDCRCFQPLVLPGCPSWPAALSVVLHSLSALSAPPA